MYPIQSLSNMEYALYGNNIGFGNAAAPSMLNGYQATSPYLTSYPSYYNMYNSAYASPYNNLYNQNAQTLAQAQTQAQVPSATASQSDIDKIADFYNKQSQDSEGLGSNILTNLAFASFIMNPRLMIHPVQSIRGLKNTEALFNGIRENGTKMNAFWTENNYLARQAYFRTHKLEARNFWKLGLFRKSIKGDEYKAIKPVMDELRAAMEAGNTEKVAELTAKLKVAYTNNGPLMKFGGWCKGLFGKERKPNTIADALKDTKAINEVKTKLLENSGKLTFKKALKRGGGIKGGLLFMGIELLMGLGNIKEAFSKDNKTGLKQVGQTLVNGAGSAIGWAGGEALGTMAAAKICAGIGTAIAPGVGTAIGGVLGMVCGGIGMWLFNKFTKKVVGQDVGEKVKLEKMKQTPEGQIQLLQLTAQNKNIPLDVQQSMENVINQYSSAA